MGTANRCALRCFVILNARNGLLLMWKYIDLGTYQCESHASAKWVFRKTVSNISICTHENKSLITLLQILKSKMSFEPKRVSWTLYPFVIAMTSSRPKKLQIIVYQQNMPKYFINSQMLTRWRGFLIIGFGKDSMALVCSVFSIFTTGFRFKWPKNILSIFLPALGVLVRKLCCQSEKSTEILYLHKHIQRENCEWYMYFWTQGFDPQLFPSS